MYKVKLKSFEGPFDLLVYLIENAEMSIYDIKISEITNQYLAYLKEMEERDVALASEFMVLASSLIEIKSKMILPRATEDGQEIVGEDPRTELVARLLEYKRFKELSQMLEEREEHISCSRFVRKSDKFSALKILFKIKRTDMISWLHSCRCLRWQRQGP